jgi:FkbM family methyltransferase
MKFIRVYISHQMVLVNHYATAFLMRVGRKAISSKKFSSKYKQLFLFLINLHFKSKHQSHRFGFSGAEGKYFVQEDNEERYFLDTTQNYWVYQQGIQARAETLSQAYLLDYVKFTEGASIIDCGANIGDLDIAVRKYLNAYDYFAFEPSLDEFGCLISNTKRGKCFNLALWDKSETIDFYISTENADSSTITPEIYSKKISIEGERLDSEKFGFGRISLLKLEAEGAEIEVIEGAEGILHRIAYITADLGFERNGQSTLPEVTNFLLSRGFEIVKFGTPRIVVLFRNTKCSWLGPETSTIREEND